MTAVSDETDLKRNEVLSFDDGLLTIKISGHGAGDGWGSIAFHDRQIEIDADGFHIAEIPPSELRALRDFLNRIIPAALSAAPVAQEPVATKKVYIKPLRTIVEIQTAYADQIRDWLNTSPPATPAGLGADEIARVFVRWKKSKNLHESLAAQNIEKELLALLSRAGDQSNSHHEEQSKQNI